MKHDSDSRPPGPSSPARPETFPTGRHSAPLRALAAPSGMSRREALGTSASVVLGAALGLGCRDERGPAAQGTSEPVRQDETEKNAASDPIAALSPEQRAMLDEIVDVLIPETNTPGARRAGVSAYIESVVLAVYEESTRAAFLAGLAALDATARQKHGQRFTACAPEARVELVHALFATTEARAGKATPAAESTGNAAPAANAATKANASPATAANAATTNANAATTNANAATTNANPATPVAPGDAEAAVFRRQLRELTIHGFCRSKLGATRVLQYEPIPGAYDGCRSLESVGRAWATS